MRRFITAPEMPAFFVLCVGILVMPFPAAAQAQTHGEIRGQVIDAQNGEALPGANVQVQGTLFGSSTDRNGVFVIKRLQPGIYTLRASFIGYKIGRASVRVKADSATSVNFALQPSPVEMAQVVVTASREVEEVQTAVVSVSALTSRDVVRRNSLRLDDALESLPGVSLIGGNVKNVNIRNSTGFTRGIASRVLILLDDVPVLISDFGSMNWDMLPVTDVERVEVIKGPYSALYGSYALGGVINIITKPPSPQGKFSLRTSAGIYDEPYEAEWRWTERTLHFDRIDLSYSKQVGKLGFRFSLGRHQSTGDRQNGHFQRWNGTGKLIWALGNGSELVLFGAYARDRRGEFVYSRGENPYLVPQDFLAYRTSLDAYTIYAHYRLRANDWLELKWQASLVGQLTGNQFNVEGDFKPAQGPGASWQMHARLNSNMSLKIGLEYHYDFMEQRHVGRHFAHTISPYLYQIWRPTPKLRLTAGLRYDHYYLLPAAKFQLQFVKSDTVFNPLPDGLKHKFWSPQFGMSYQLSAATALRAALGWGIRIPALGERFLQFDIPLRFKLNADIKTERSFSFELGLRQRLGSHAHLEATAFHTLYHDMIEPLIQEDVSLKQINIPQTRIAGIEASGRFQLWRDRLGLEANATWTDPVIIDVGHSGEVPSHFKEGQLMSYRPRLHAYVSPSLHFGPFSLEADYSYASTLQREQLQIFLDDQRVPKKQLDMRLLCRWQGLTAQLAVRNLLHYTHAQTERIVNDVRSFSIGIMYEN
jgi:iron complex outermembrane receptor protein